MGLVLLLILLPTPPLFAAERLQIYTVNYPLAYFAERIAGDLADVRLPAPPDVDPAFWMPGSDTIGAYQAADLIVLNGADYAKWVRKDTLGKRARGGEPRATACVRRGEHRSESLRQSAQNR